MFQPAEKQQAEGAFRHPSAPHKALSRGTCKQWQSQAFFIRLEKLVYLFSFLGGKCRYDGHAEKQKDEKKPILYKS